MEEPQYINRAMTPKCYPSQSCGNAIRTGPLTGDQPSGANVSQSTNSGECASIPARYNTRQHAPPSKSENGQAGWPRAPSWVLIEWDRPNGVPSSYAVIASTQIVGRAPDRRDQTAKGGGRTKDSEFYTGNLIHVKNGEQILPATIVMVSDDKKFIETELRQLRNIAAHNLNTKSATQSRAFRNTSTEQKALERKPRVALQHHIEPQDTRPMKRQRNDSMSSFTECSSMSPASSEISTSDKSVPISHRAATALSEERVITPRTDRTVRSNVIQPMTFDQQTQTVGGPAFSGGSGNDAQQLGKILSYLESVLTEQKCCRMEREYDRKLLHDLHEKLILQETLLKRIDEKLANSERKQYHVEQPKQGDISDNVIEMNLSLIDRCLMTDESGKLLGEYRCNEEGFLESSPQETLVNVVHLDANSNQSWTPSVDASQKSVTGSTGNSALLVDGSCAMSSATNQNRYGTSDESRENFLLPPPESSTESRVDNDQLNHASSNSVDDLKKDWDDALGDEECDRGKGEDELNSPRPLPEIWTETPPSAEHMVSIGANGTLVKQQAIQKIKWSNYKSATRKLLMEVFGRDMLATHSLSGRPSPAMRADTDKPVKDRLKATAVADVMELVSKMCNVNEGLVRNVITAKCADENKMRKQRAGIAPRRMIVTITNTEPQRPETENVLAITDNKENVC